MKILSILCFVSAVKAFIPSENPKQTSRVLFSAVSDEEAFKELKEIASAANPVISYYDPLDLASYDKIGDGQAQNIGWLRHAEIKHGRVAMAAFVGYCVQSKFTWPVEGPWSPVDIGPEAQWDALPNDVKVYLILAIGIVELIDEADSNGHYMNGRDPGRHYLFQRKTNKKKEKLAEGRIKEINNGRLAMLGIMGFVSSSSIPGAVPLLNGAGIPTYSGNFWAPFQADFSFSNMSTLMSSSEAVTSASDTLSTASIL